MTKATSLAALDVRAASAVPYEFELKWPGGAPTGRFVSVFGSQAEVVQDAINASGDASRQKQLAIDLAISKGDENVPITTVAEDLAAADTLAAVRIAGWRKPGDTTGLTEEQAKRLVGIEDPVTPENKLALVRSFNGWRKQIVDESNEVTHFLKISA